MAKAGVRTRTKEGILFLRVKRDNGRWFRKLVNQTKARGVDHVTQSTVVDRIFINLRKNKALLHSVLKG